MRTEGYVELGKEDISKCKEDTACALSTAIPVAQKLPQGLHSGTYTTTISILLSATWKTRDQCFPIPSLKAHRSN